MNKNPFSLYDFLGYLFPGVLALLLFSYSLRLWGSATSICDIFSLSSLCGNDKEDTYILKWESTVVLLLMSYIAGHVIAYLSSCTVEYLSTRLFGYPSHYLLHDETKDLKLKKIFRNYFVDEKTTLMSFIWRCIVFILLLPIIVFLLITKQDVVKFIIRPLDEYVRDSIKSKMWKFTKKQELTLPDVNQKADYHRIIMHYVYLNIQNCQRKTDNYVAMYGFLRAITLISCLFLDFMMALQVMILFPEDKSAVVKFDGAGLLYFILVFILCNVLYMGFVKFYRRFTLENYMALLSEKN